MIGATGWGRKELDDAGRRALAAYCHRYGVDPLTELDWLDGPYINAEFFKRKLGELRLQGIIRDHELDHVHLDTRLLALAENERAPQEIRDEAAAQYYRATFLRGKHNIPDEAEAACICRIYLPDGNRPLVGVKWAGNGTSTPQPRQGQGPRPNPVMELNPVLSVESQSIRRAMLQLGSQVSTLLPQLERMEAEAAAIGADAAPRVAAQRAAEEADAVANRPRALAAPADYYGTGAGASPVWDMSKREPARAAAPAANPGRHFMRAGGPDPYGFDREPDALGVMQAGQGAAPPPAPLPAPEAEPEAPPLTYDEVLGPPGEPAQPGDDPAALTQAELDRHLP
jgi:hypothetical protein